MRDDFHAEEELSLGDIFRALYSKAVILIAVLVLGCLIGGMLGYFTSRNCTHQKEGRRRSNC